MAAVSLEGITKRFGTVVALDKVDLEISPGEFMVLVGPSGCGKTTLLRIIAGLAEPTSGRVMFDGKPVEHLAPGNRDIAMVFQNYALFPHMTVERNLSFGLRVRKQHNRDGRDRIEETARLLKIDGLMSRFPKELSGGQKQRVALGRALVRQPKVFLFDEPLSNLDQALRVEMRAEIAELHRKFPITTVYVTHDQVEAMTMGNRIAVMNEGLFTQVGKPSDIYNDPGDLFTASFIGSPAINQFEGALDNGKLASSRPGAFEIDLAEGSLPSNLPKQVTACFRPEHLLLGNAGQKCSIRSKVKLVEELGREHIVYLESGGLALRLILPAGNASIPVIGEELSLIPDLHRAMWFDTNSGLRIR